MSQFPEAIQTPDFVNHARKERSHLLKKTLLYGIFLRLIIAIIECFGFLYSGSSSLLLDALSTGLDIISSLALLLCVQLASKPPDSNHPLGHGRSEPIAGMQVGIFMTTIGGGMFFQQAFHLFHERKHDAIHPLMWIIPLLAIILLEIAYRMSYAAAKKTKSTALSADAAHYRIDALSSLFALIALFFGSLNPSYSAIYDHVGALAIAVLMIIIGVYSASSNIHQLMDRIPEKWYFNKVREAALSVEGVLETEKLRIQRFGPDAQISIDIEVDPDMTVSKAHTLSQHVRVAIQKALPEVRDAIVHLEPYYPDDHEVD